MTSPAKRAPALPPSVAVLPAVVALILLGWLFWQPSSGDGAAGPEPAATHESGGSHQEGSLPACDDGALPAEVDDVVQDIESGGPFGHPRHDAATFHNREGLLPEAPTGYYREFTVDTPGLDHRGTRRIVTGGREETEPEYWYFTDDHYESFCELAEP